MKIYKIMAVRQKSTLIVTSIRLSEGLMDFIKTDIEENKLHVTLSDWVQTACLLYRDKRLAELRDGSTPPPVATQKNERRIKGLNQRDFGGLTSWTSSW